MLKPHSRVNLVVNEFPEVFIEYLLVVPIEREIDFGLDLILDPNLFLFLFSRGIHLGLTNLKNS